MANYMVGWYMGQPENLLMINAKTAGEAVDCFLDQVENNTDLWPDGMDLWGKTILVYEESIWEAQPPLPGRPTYKRLT